MHQPNAPAKRRLDAATLHETDLFQISQNLHGQNLSITLFLSIPYTGGR